MGLCDAHYRRKLRGSPLQSPMRDSYLRGEREESGWTSWRKHKKSGYVVRSRVFEGSQVFQSQHRVVFETILGRPLLTGEEVHHKSGQRDDNRPENLELWSTRQPKGQRVDDKVQFALETLRLYRPEALS